MTETDAQADDDELDRLIDGWVAEGEASKPLPTKAQSLIEEHVRVCVKSIIKHELEKAFEQFQTDFESQLNFVLRKAATDAAHAVKRGLEANA